MKRPALTLLLTLAIIATFGQIVTHEFVSWDDQNTIQRNPNMRPPSLAGTAWYWTHSADGLYVPLTYSVWSALATVAQTHTLRGSIELNPWVFHAASVLCHLLSAILVMDILRRLVGKNGPAFVGAMIFALHPFQVETVAWASGLKDVLCGMLSLAAIRAYVRFAQRRREENSSVQWVLAAGLLLLAMLAKPIGFVGPLMAAAIDLWVIGRPAKQVLRSILPLLFLAAPFLIIARVAQIPPITAYTSLWTRPLIAADSLTFYLNKLIFPWPLTLAYGHTPMLVLKSGALAHSWIVPVALGLILVLIRHRMPVLVASASLFVAGLLPVLGLVNFMMQIHSTVADHYMYLPMLGVALAAAWVVSKSENRVFQICVAIVILTLAGLSFVQGRFWQDDLTLFAHAAAVGPNNQDALHGLGNALQRADRMDEAIVNFHHAVEIDPANRISRELLTQALVFTGQYEQALPHAYESLRLAHLGHEVDTSQDEFLLGRALSQLGRSKEAEEHLAEAARQQPNDRQLAAELESVRRRVDSPATTQ